MVGRGRRTHYGFSAFKGSLGHESTGIAGTGATRPPNLNEDHYRKLALLGELVGPGPVATSGRPPTFRRLLIVRVRRLVAIEAQASVRQVP